MTPKILLFDCETTPCRAWFWRTGKQYVSHEQIVEGDATRIICIAYKWVGSPKVTILDYNFGASEEDMLKKFAKVAESADIVVGHNADKFDIKVINSQRLLLGLSPINWPSSEDTLKMFRQKFSLPSFRLDYISKILTGSGKSPMNFQDWIDIVEKHDKKALRKMLAYCKRDVAKLGEVFEAALPHLTLKANRSIIRAGTANGCPACGKYNSENKGYRYMAKAKQQRRKCIECGHNFCVKA